MSGNEERKNILKDVASEVADRLEEMPECLPGCTIDFYSTTAEVIELKALAWMLRQVIEDE